MYFITSGNGGDLNIEHESVGVGETPVSNLYSTRGSGEGLQHTICSGHSAGLEETVTQYGGGGDSMWIPSQL
jgi:hypothetical protein